MTGGGDVYVWGRLRGEATAGVYGDESCIIAALQMQPSMLRIAGSVAYGPDDDEDVQVASGAEVASIGGGGAIEIAPAAQVS